MTRKNILTVVIVMLFSTFSILAQEENTEKELSLTEGSINNQFEYIFKKANNYQDYKVVKHDWLLLLKKNTLDSIAKLEDKLTISEKLASTQKVQIDSLNKELNAIDTQLTNATDQKDNISFFGTHISKPTYKTIMWGIVATLALILGIFIYKFKNANTITQEAKKTVAELEEEYEEYRRKALEREQKVKRQLQDEINKQKQTKTK